MDQPRVNVNIPLTLEQRIERYLKQGDIVEVKESGDIISKITHCALMEDKKQFMQALDDIFDGITQSSGDLLDLLPIHSNRVDSYIVCYFYGMLVHDLFYNGVGGHRLQLNRLLYDVYMTLVNTNKIPAGNLDKANNFIKKVFAKMTGNTCDIQEVETVSDEPYYHSFGYILAALHICLFAESSKKLPSIKKLQENCNNQASKLLMLAYVFGKKDN